MNDRFEDEWLRCAPWLEAALEYAHGTHTLEDVKAAVLRGDSHFWAGEQCALVTEFVDYPQFRTLNFWLAGGDLEELRDVWRPRVEAFAKHYGAKFASINGRLGWARAIGYAPVHYTCAKELT